MKKGIDYIGVGVGAAIFNEEGKLFVALRGKEAKNERGKWEFPGGSVEFGETFEQAIKREIKEELDIEIEIIDLLGICDHIIPNENQHWVSPTYICKIKKGTPKILEPHKCSQIGWFTLAEAEKLPLSIVTKYDIALLKKKYPNGIEKEQQIHIVPYDPTWPTKFEAEKVLIQQTLGSQITGEIHHVGSTSIPELSAKPIIDIMVGVKNLKEAKPCIDLLAKINFPILGY